MTERMEKTREALQRGDAVTIVAFGDSITEGYEVTRGFVDFWEEALRWRFPSCALNMINAGRCGYATFNQKP